MIDLAVPHEARNHRQCTRGEHVVDERFLTLQSLRSRATRQRPLTQRRIHNRGKQLGNGTQPSLGPAIDAVEGLTKDELAIAGVVPNVQPVANTAPGPHDVIEGLVHRSPGRASIDTTDDEVDRIVIAAAGVVLGTLAEECLVRMPGELVEEVDSVDEDRGLVLPNVGGAEGLANAVGGRNGVGVHHCHIEAVCKSPGDKSVVQVG